MTEEKDATKNMRTHAMASFLISLYEQCFDLNDAVGRASIRLENLTYGPCRQRIAQECSRVFFSDHKEKAILWLG